jgi:O-methyltransferase involved in polyketide biosynthesis
MCVMMNTVKIAPDLENVQKTLLLPLWGRAQASRMKEPVLIDRKAMELIDQMDYDFSPLFKNLGLFHALSLAVRAKEFDTILLDFIRRKGSASVVNIGAGLDTAFSRVHSGHVKWFDVDMPGVIALRKKLIPETSGMSEIPKSMFDESFLDDIGDEDNVLFIVGGVFMYFEETQVRQFFELISSRFQASEIVFDVLSPWGIHYYNRKLEKSGFHGAVMKWGITDLQKIEDWNPRLMLVKRSSFYSNVSAQSAWPLGSRMKMRLINLLALAGIVHMKIA